MRTTCVLTGKGGNWRISRARARCVLGTRSPPAHLLAWASEHSVKEGNDCKVTYSFACNLPHANEVIQSVFSLGNHSCQHAGGILWPCSHALTAAGWDSPLLEPPSILPHTPTHNTSHLCWAGSGPNEHLHEQFRSLYKLVFVLQKHCTFS